MFVIAPRGLEATASRASPTFLPAARETLAAYRLDESVKISTTIVVGDLVSRLDGLESTDLDCPLDNVGLGIGAARMVDVACDILPVRAVDGPAAVDLE